MKKSQYVAVGLGIIFVGFQVNFMKKQRKQKETMDNLLRLWIPRREPTLQDKIDEEYKSLVSNFPETGS